MRLSCPNCGAQYEVPVEVIPQEGRDVQCSNCGHTWFQVHPDEDVDLAHEVGGSVPDEGWSPEEASAQATTRKGIVDDPAEQPAGSEIQPPETVFEDEPVVSGDAVQEAEADARDLGPDSKDLAEESPADDDLLADPDADAAPENEIKDVSDAGDTVSEDDAPETPATGRSAIDPAVADVLRQEAGYETQAREAETRQTLETQTELGLSDPPRKTDTRAEEARSRMRRIRGLTETEKTPEEPAEPQTGPLEATSRSDLLPDIEEINSTLRSTDERSPADNGLAAVSAKTRRRSGFRLGFGFIMLFAAMVILTYVYNQEIVKAYPEAQPYIASFMEQMNVLRVWLDTRVTEGMLWINEKAGLTDASVD